MPAHRLQDRERVAGMKLGGIGDMDGRRARWNVGVNDGRLRTGSFLHQLACDANREMRLACHQDGRSLISVSGSA
jgi:hypothetical protein